MKLYGAKITQRYIEYKDHKKKHVRYPNSVNYPSSAKYHDVPIKYPWRNKT